MYKRIRIAALVPFVLAAALAPVLSAQADQVTDKLKTTLQARLGSQATIKGIVKAPVAGLYEVNLGSQLAYADASGDYLLIGDLIDTKTRRDITDARFSELNKVNFASLPLANAVKVVKGNGSRKMAVFSDPNCPYCHQLENTLKSVNNVTVYTFLYPILSADSTAKAKSIWCSGDRAKTWQAWMLDRRTPSAAGNCDTTAITSNLKLGAKLGVDGTPTLIMADGRRMSGAMPADELNKALNSAR